MASSLIRFNCVPKSPFWRAPRPSISTPAPHETTRLPIRTLLTTTSKRETLLRQRQARTQSNRIRSHSKEIQTQTTQPKPSQNPPKPTNPRPPQPSNLLLAQQRLNRPLSPHLTLYRPQITSVLSVLQRLTGLTLSGVFTLLPILYLLSSSHFDLLNINLSAESLAASFGSLPWVVKSGVKFGVAWIFCFHGLNSPRFLTWRFARGIDNRKVQITGWAAVGGSVLGALGMVFIL